MVPRKEVLDEIEKLQFQKPSYVYLMRAGTTNHYKIGKADDVQKRRDALQTGNQHPIAIVATLRTYVAGRLEKKMHNFFKAKRLHGEWYALTEEDVAQFRSHPLACKVPQ